MDLKFYVILGGFAGALIALFLLKAFTNLKTKRRFKRAKKSEVKAVKLLKKYGFEIIDLQKTKNYNLIIDGKFINATVRADMIAKRGNKIYVVEVKSGKKAPSLKNIATRRQLLEYYLVYKPDGLILVDMEREKIHSVDYSIFNKRYNWLKNNVVSLIVALVIGFIVGFLTRGD